MRSYHYIIVCLVLILFFGTSSALRLPLTARQDGETSPEPSQTPATAETTPSPSPSEKPESTETQPESRTQTSQATITSSTNSVTATTIISVTQTSTSNGGPPSATAEPQSSNPLPIHPKLTPAMGLSGVILLISGVVYAVIGIKNQWLYVFFSAAYLACLAVTVLIIYLMTPPVSDAIQGAFFVAAVLSGILFGALSLVFSDITDGLGCLLGGFCLSMWFLSLREGGLIQSTAGRAIFIGCMSVAAYSLSFSHYTRTYGLMGAISFAGSTITMLGIDCLSRAGWKEFWLYLWDLNSAIFPLHTDTYPITRGMKAEVAGVVLFTVFGIVSQLKLWRIVKARREKSAAARLEKEQDLRRHEEEVGRRIQHNVTRERARWEATYGDNSQQQDSVIDSSHRSSLKTSTSVREKEVTPVDTMEMAALPARQISTQQVFHWRSANKNMAKVPPVTVTVVEDDDEIRQIDGEGQPTSPTTYTDLSVTTQGDAGRSRDNRLSVETPAPPSISTRSSLRTPVSPPPDVVPLPFAIPKEDGVSQDADNMSVSAVADSVYEPVSARRSLSKRISSSSVLKRFSGGQVLLDDLEEALIIPHEEDRSSSVAATMDDEYESVSLADSGRQSARASKSDENLQLPTETGKAEPDSTALPSENQLFGKVNALGRKNDDIAEGLAANHTSFVDPAQQSDSIAPGAEEARKNDWQTESANAYANSQSSPTATESPKGLSKDVLPVKLSKVALSYRTNEWAKHLELAEQPELDEIPEPESPGIKILHESNEPVAPITDEIKGVQPAKTLSKRISTDTNPYRNSNLIRSASNISSVSRADSPKVGSSRPVSAAQNRGIRHSSTSLTSQTLNQATARISSTPSPIPSNTLGGKREAPVRNKITTQTSTPRSSTLNLQSSTTSLLSNADQENMTLAQRRQLIKTQRPPSASQQRRQSHKTIEEQTQGFNSHQPRRASGGVDPNRREIMLAGWRESMRREGTPGQRSPTADDESRRIALMNEKRQKETEKQQREQQAQQRESAMGSMMRSGDMLDAHREAMRRLQAKANRNAS